MRSPNLPDLSFIVQLLLATSRLISADRINCTIFGHDYKFTEWDTDEWAIINHQPVQGDFRHRLSLANGYLGISVAGIGPFFEVEDPTANRFLGDWPLYNRRQAFATIAGFYGEHDNLTEYNFPWLALYSNESVISGIPHWAGLYVQVNDNVLNATVNASQIVDGSFTSTLNITEGRLTWKYTWRPDSETPIHVEYSVFVHKRLVPLAAVQLRLTSERDVAIIVHDVLEGEGATYSEFLDKGVDLESPTIWSAVRPLNVNNRTAFVFSTLRVNNDTDFHSSGRIRTDGDLLTPNASSIGQGYHMNLTAGKPVQVDKFVGAASSDIYKDPARVARDFSNLGATKGFAELLKSHIEEWSSILTRDSVDRYMSEDGPRCNDSNLIFLSITAVTNTFYILQNTVGPNAGPLSSHGSLGASSIPVCGLGSDCYGGFIMWDAEVFIAPGLQVSHPFSMQQVTRYRQEKFAQAKRNVGASRYSSRKDTKFSDRGAVYPWTSGAVGNCTGTGPCFDYEYHLNGAIGISLFNEFAVTGDMEYFKENLFPISTAVAHFLSEVLVYNTSTNVYEILNATDPDEWAESINRPAYTHALISKHLNDTIWLSDWLNITEYPRQEWSNKASLIPMPIDPATGIVKEYEDMTGEVWVKQADVVLIDDLLHYHHNQSLVALDYYAAKQAENGPAMTYTSFSIVANEISPSGCSSGMIIPCIQTPVRMYSTKLCILTLLQ
jgi:trehalose/maltose hydrolase-like predicted phosphorylase